MIGDVSDTYDQTSGKRGVIEHQDLSVDCAGLVHIMYYENRERSSSVWAGAEQDHAHSRLFHAVGPPGGPFVHHALGCYNSCRLVETADGRFHYFLTRGARGQAESVWYSTGCGPSVPAAAAAAAGSAVAAADPCWARHKLSAPVQLEGVGPLHHFFVSSPRAGGSIGAEIDCYWHGARESQPHEVMYGRLTPAAHASWCPYSESAQPAQGMETGLEQPRL